MIRFFLFIFIFFGKPLFGQQNFDIIPYPDEVQPIAEWSTTTNIYLGESSMLDDYKPWLMDSGLPIVFDESQQNFFIELDTSLEKRTYELRIDKDHFWTKVQSKKDLRNAFVSLLQLYNINHGKFPQTKIVDHAEYDYRGMHLDVARHFFSVNEVKKYIDYLTFYKYNYFHWHLTDDQGWRIEIKKYPRLQEISAFRNETLIGHYNDHPHQYDGIKYGGFYTQDEVREVVAYAKTRGITIIPEIELPGHAQAALAAYPELGCKNQKIEVATKWGVFSDVFCPKEETFQFLQDVLAEVIELFPSPYIHIGGDECPKDSWKQSDFCQSLMKQEHLSSEEELQSYFIGRISSYLNQKGKTIIGWDEILEGGLQEGAIVMSWRGQEGGIEAAKSGHRAIMTPGSHCYFDHYQSTHADEPLAIGGYTPVQKVHAFQATPQELSEDEKTYIWGVQGNVWTEYMTDFSQVEYMALARMIALSEVQWIPEEDRNYNQFSKRLDRHILYWQSRDVHIADHQLDIEVEVRAEFNKGSVAYIKNPMDNLRYYSEFQGQNTLVSHEGSALQKDGAYQFRAETPSKKGRFSTIYFLKHLGNKAKIKLAYQASKSYPGSGATALINGIDAPTEKYGGSEWLGFSGNDCIAEIEFPQVTDIQNITIQIYNGEGQWIYLPSYIDIFYSEDGIHYQSFIRKTVEKINQKVVTIAIPVNLKSKYIQIRAKNHGIIEAGAQGAGHPSWLFIGEIKIE